MLNNNLFLKNTSLYRPIYILNVRRRRIVKITNIELQKNFFYTTEFQIKNL